ncbi:uncharacterized protein [Nerophis lumbriciformis]|uniref:uncharacterized protein isoform X1 n=2 Tax=Nerophis lumbriciformis TaxID=546530 RepID=UPI002ADF86F6|nr:uncharacterized protein si:ch211-199g17.2 isoform X1 [Nerophis lumbriciformis]
MRLSFSEETPSFQPFYPLSADGTREKFRFESGTPQLFDMQPLTTQKVVSSELFESLKLYLSNKSRLQPIIGLRCITECVKVGSSGREALYLCEVCKCRLSKGDMRNHIMGSLHRYNYTKVWYPDLLSDVKEDTDMSLLARPLMEIARVLEDKDGPGDIKLLEVEDAAFQMIKGYSDSEAISLIRFLAHGAAHQPADTPTMSSTSVRMEEEEEQQQQQEEEEEEDQSQRMVLLGHREVLVAADDLDPSSAPWSRGLVHKVPQPRCQGNGSNFLNGYKGGKPLIGLHRVSECIGEDGYTACFLCHCCCTRVNKWALIEHVSSSAHVLNYLMETRHEQVEVMGADVHTNGQLLQSLAKQVEREEGRGDMEVVSAPPFLCGLLSNKGYNWCIKRLWKRTYPNTRRWNKANKGSRVNRPPKHRESHSRKRRTEAKPTVFKVSLPLTEGPLLLERTSFSQESPPGSPVPWFKSQKPEPNLESEVPGLNIDSEPPAEIQSFNVGLGEDRYAPADLAVEHYVGQPDMEDVNPGGLQHVLESPGRDCMNEWQSGAPGAEWSTDSHAFSHKQGYALQFYNSSSRPSGNAHSDVPATACIFDYRHQPAAQSTSHGISSVAMVTAGHHLNTQKMPPPFVYSPAVHSNGTAPAGHGVHIHGIKQERYQTYTQFQSGHAEAAQTYWTHPVAYQAVQVGQGQVYQGYNTSPWGSQPSPYCPHPGGHWGAHLNASVSPGPAL